MLAIALKLFGIGKAIFAPIASLWRWLAADWHRMAFAALIALCALLAWRLHAVDADRDAWRAKTEAMIAAAKEVARANEAAGKAGVAVAQEQKGKVNERVERARDASNGSSDPLDSALRCLRSPSDCGGNPPAR